MRRPFSLLYLLPFFISVFSQAGIHKVDILPGGYDKSKESIRILDQKQLIFQEINAVKFSEISDLTYHKETGKLYMISDEGKLFDFNARFDEKIALLEPAAATTLRKKNGKKFKSWRHDSEGLTLDGKNRLLVSFEGKAKIGWFHKNSAKFGRLIKKYKIPKPLRDPNNYRSKNKSLEALAWHPVYGILTVAEWPLKKDHKKHQTIYALNGKRWHFKAEPETKSAVSAIEVMDDGNVLVIERSYSDMLSPLIVTLKKVYLDRCQKGLCQSKVLLKMNSHRGWGVDNFEGLAHVGQNRYVMISDDNDNFFQKTLLIYFEVLERK
jgi:hypothetical protein